MTTRANLYVDQGVDFAIFLDLFGVGGADYTITDQVFKCEVRKVFSSSIAFQASVQVISDNEKVNDISLSIPANTTADVDPGKYQYDIIMDDGVTKYKILEGLMFILPTITR